MGAEPRTAETPDTAATLSDGDAPARAAHDPIAAGATIGRYIVLGRLGAGGMGVVYAAYDPELDRKVAIKLLHGELSDERARLRMLREAQAMARLNHPNVITVHDVGVHEDRVWLSMEFVDGTTLSGWSAARPRSWREVLEVALAVARGVAAAHEVGLVHRDLKPDNVMVGKDASSLVRVMDFGLARVSTRETEEREATDVALPRVEALEARLTAADGIVGTPAYMAPEQFANRPVEQAADQFSFCVLLWEALYGERPFGGRSALELGYAVLHGERRSPPSGRAVPRWLCRVIERGLAVAPEARWPSMARLIAELERGRGRAGRRKGVVVMAGLGAIAAAGLGVRAIDRAADVRACEQAAVAVEEIWNDVARKRVREGLLATDTAYAEQALDGATRWIDARATEWSDVRRRTCLAARETASARDDPRIEACLDEQRAEIATLVDTLQSADSTMAQRAVQAAAGLPRAADCEDERRLSLRKTPPESIVAELADVHERLRNAATLSLRGEFERSLAAAESAANDARALEWEPSIARADLQVAKSLALLARYEEAERTLESLVYTATGSGDEPMAAEAARELVDIVGVRGGRHVEGRRWARLADSLLTRSGEPADGIARAGLDVTRGDLEYGSGEYDAAQELYERALAIHGAILGETHPSLAEIHNDIGGLLAERGAYESALQHLERARAIWEESLGPAHPVVANALSSLARVHTMTGGYAAARSSYERALHLREQAFGPDHLAVADVLSDLGSLYYVQHDYEPAKQLYERAWTIIEATLGAEHVQAAALLSNLGNIDAEQGRPREALDRQTRALAIRERALGPEHAEVGLSHNSVGAALQSLKDDRGALEHFGRALEIWERALGPEHPYLAYALTGQGKSLLAQDRAAEAVTALERAVTLREGSPTHPAELGDSRSALARALWDRGEDADRSRAVALAERALSDLREAGDTSGVEAMERWLAEHRP